MHKLSRVGAITTTPGIRFFAAYVFLLFAAPRLSVKIGPVPIYAIDLLLCVCIVHALQSRTRMPPLPKFHKIIIFILFFVYGGELASAYYSQTILQPFYMMFRYTLAFSLVFVTFKLINTNRDLYFVLRSVAYGVLVTAFLMIFSSLPFTRSFVSPLFDLSFLEPAAETYKWYGEDAESGIRGRTLVGVSILGATFINAGWPLAVVFASNFVRKNHLSLGGALASYLAPLGVITSYSRGPILGHIAMILYTLFFAKRRFSNKIIRPILLTALLVSIVGVGSQLFFFERLQNRFEATLNNPLEDERETERLLAYIEPFEFAADHPSYLVVGEGLSISKTATPPPSTLYGNRANHAMFAAAFYNQGMIAAILYIFLMLRVGAYAFRARSMQSRIHSEFYTAVKLSYIALIPWCLFGHAMVSTPRGAMLFYFVIGCIAMCAKFPNRKVLPIR